MLKLKIYLLGFIFMTGKFCISIDLLAVREIQAAGEAFSVQAGQTVLGRGAPWRLCPYLKRAAAPQSLIQP